MILELFNLVKLTSINSELDIRKFRLAHHISKIMDPLMRTIVNFPLVNRVPAHSNFFHFHAGSAKKLPNKKLTHPL